MWNAENDDDAAFQRRMDALCAEIGERGKLSALPEAVPPEQVQAKAPAPTPAPEPAPTSASTPAPTPTTSSPSGDIIPTRAPAPAPISSTTGVSKRLQPADLVSTPSAQHTEHARSAPGSSQSIFEVTAFLELAERIQTRTDEKVGQLREEMKAQAKAEQEVTKADLRRELTPKAVVTDAQLEELQSRLETLHSSQLISEDVLFVPSPIKQTLSFIFPRMLLD